MWSILAGILIKIIELFIKGEVDVEIKNEGEIHSGNPSRRTALVNMLKLHYSSKNRIHPTKDSSNLEAGREKR